MIFLGEKALSIKINNSPKKDNPYTLFLGAGASKTSNILLASELIYKWKMELLEILKKQNSKYRNIEDEDWINNKSNDQFKSDFFPNYYSWKKFNNPNGEDSDYSFLFSTIHPKSKDRQIFIEQLIEGAIPTLGYLFLSGIINSGGFKHILTTNFDDLIGDALFKWYSIKPLVCAFDSMVGGIRLDGPRPKIIKLHGDYLYDNLKNIRSELRSLDSNMEQKMFEMCKEGLIVVGYAGGDKSIMNLINEMLRKTEYLDMGLHWCFMKSEVYDIKNIISGKETNSEIINKYRELIELQNQYQNDVYFYEIDDFDSLMETIFIDTNSEKPKIFENPIEVNPFQEFREAVRLGKPIGHHTPYQIEMMTKFESAQFSKKSIEDIVGTGENFFKKGISAREKAKIGKSKDKSEHLRKASESFLDCIKYLDPHILKFNNMNDIPKEDLGNYIYSLKRLSGVYISLAKVNLELKENNETILDNLKESLRYVERGIVIIKKLAPSEKKIFKADIVSYPYNGCCAISIKANLNKTIEEKDKNKIFEFIELDILLQPDKSHITSLLKEADFAFILNAIGKEIKAKFKIR
jgi:SIR2-like protein